MKQEGLGKSYSAEVDRVGKDQWSDLLKIFDDATIYQTWSYGAARWGENNLSHLIIKKHGQIRAVAQSRITKFPGIGGGIAYIDRGPLWHIREKGKEWESFRQAIRALIQEYVINRGLFLRIKPNEIDDGTGTIRNLLRIEGFQWRSAVPPYRTILVDLTPSTDELLKGLKKKWRENLRSSQRNGLNVLQGHGDDLYEKFSVLYKEMHARKKFIQYVNINEFRNIQKSLPESQKMNIMICENDGESIAGLVWSAIGDRGIPIFSATGNKGLKLRGSYLLRWQMLEELKKRGCRYLDQGGIDPGRNPGGYHFKAGMGGIEVCSVGQFDACQNRMSSLAVTCAEIMRSIFKKIKHEVILIFKG